MKSPICSPSEQIVHLNLQRRCSRNAGAPSRFGGAARISPHFNHLSQKTNKRRRKELNYGWLVPKLRSGCAGWKHLDRVQQVVEKLRPPQPPPPILSVADPPPGFRPHDPNAANANGTRSRWRRLIQGRGVPQRIREGRGQQKEPSGGRRWW